MKLGRIFFFHFLFLMGISPAFAQINFTANDKVTPYTGNFSFGSNMGYYPPFSDEQLADVLRGNPKTPVEGVGVGTIRPALPENFVEFWGYDIRLATFKHYTDIGIKDNTVFIGYPSPEHRDTTKYCPNAQSNLFKNLYTDIWDGGANGTPVNDNNYFALYLYKVATLYKDHIKFWEVWNEPDFDYSGNGWRTSDLEGNWWKNTPGACETALQAPVFQYVRMLRIAYEVIKYVDPTDYVAVGGIGYTSFLDVILRHTDNPDAGKATPQYPLKGGAYFDVLSYHSYPHIEGYLRRWNNATNGFIYNRHSDAAADGVIAKKRDFETILEKYGYNGTQYPRKVWIITEYNIPRKQVGDYIGSDEAQRNFMLKTLVNCQANGIGQVYVYSPADVGEETATNEFDLMGLYKKPTGNVQKMVMTDEGIAHKTASEILTDAKYDASLTAQ